MAQDRETSRGKHEHSRHHSSKRKHQEESSEFYDTFSRKSRKEHAPSHSHHDERHLKRRRSPSEDRKPKVEIKQEPVTSDEENQPIKKEADRPVKRERQESEPRRQRRQKRSNNADEDNFDWGKQEVKEEKDEKPPVDKQKPNFSLSGKLAEDTNMYNGVLIKYSEPPEACKPKRRWRFYVFKGTETMPTLYIHRQSAYLIGRDRKVADLPVDHPSCSKQHAALQYRLVPYQKPNGRKGRKIVPYIIDLESANGTFVNNKQIEPKRYVELLEKDVVKFGYSSREYVLLHEGSKGEEESPE